jgi:hypothetical protein
MTSYPVASSAARLPGLRLVGSMTLLAALLPGCLMSGLTPQPRVFCPEPQQSLPGQVAFFEGFTGVNEGAIPTGWTGGDGLAVQRSLWRMSLAPFELRPKYAFSVPNVRFSGDFQVEWALQTASGQGNDSTSGRAYSMTVGSVQVVLETGWGGGWPSRVKMGSSQAELEDLANASVLIRLTREGNVYRVFVNTKPMLLARYDNPGVIEGISFLAQNTGPGFEVVGIRISGKAP